VLFAAGQNYPGAVWYPERVSATDLAARLRAAPLFSRLEPALLASLAAEARLRSWKAGNYLWRAGEEATHFTIIQSGLVEIRREVGAETAVMGLFGAREVVGLPAVLERTPYPAAAVALSRVVEALQVRAQPVLDRLGRDAPLALAVNRALLAHDRALRTKIDVLSAGGVPQRLAALLLHLAERFGDEDGQGGLRIPVAISRVQLAHLVGARPETVIRTLGQWRRAGRFLASREALTLPRPAELERLVGAASD
jgi:CRP-like cAMP-binding protein